MVTRRQKKKAKEQIDAENRPWTVETNENGQNEIVHERTEEEERKHEEAMEKWARQMNNDRDWD